MSTPAPAADLLDSVMNRNETLHGCAAPAVEVLTKSLVTQHVADSCVGVMSTMCQVDVSVRDVADICCIRPFDLSGMVSISGHGSITIAIKLSKDLAFIAADRLLGMTPTSIDADVLDLVGELANMIAGGAKERCNNGNLRLGLPAVITGQGHRILFSKGMETWTLDFECEVGELQIELGFIPLNRS